MALDSISEKLLSEREDLVARAELVKRNALDQNRDLNDSDRESLDRFRTRIGELDEQLKVTTQDFEMDAGIRERIQRVSGAPVIKRGANPWEGLTAGQVLYDFVHAREANSVSEARVTTWRRNTDPSRAAQHMGTEAELTVPVAGGFGGLIVKPVIGPVIDLSPTETPLLNLLGFQPSPNAMRFSRPRLVDPNFTTAATEQAKQKQELNSVVFDVDGEDVSLRTYGNYLNLSLQAESFIAGAYETVFSQLVARTTYRLEASIGAELDKATAKVTLAADAGAAEVLAAWQQAAALVFQATKRAPSWAVAGIDGWARLSGLSDAAGRPLFPAAANAAVNALGQGGANSMILNVNGVPLAVSLGIEGPDIFMGNSFGLETYVYRYPVLQSVEPSVLGRQIAAAASVGHYQPPTVEATETDPAVRGGIVRIAP